MTRSLKAPLTEAAERQLKSAVRWYRKQAPAQAARFKWYLDEARARIVSWPDIGRLSTNGSRRIATRVFPFHLWYIIEGGRPVVIAVTHFHQDNDYGT